VSGRSSRENRRRAIEEARQAQQRRKRRLLLAGGAAAVVLAGTGIGLGLGLSGSGPGPGATPPTAAGGTASYAPLSSLGSLTAAPPAGALGPEAVPMPAGAAALAGTSPATAGQAVDGISCQTSEQTIFHIHTHLTLFVNGRQRQVPAGIGIPDAVAQQTQAGPFVDSGSCFYWLHTHAADGIIHIESPVKRTYTLGEFFDEWGQPLSSSQVGPARGKVTVIVNGQVFKGDPRAVPLGSRENLQVEVGTPLVAPETINWASTGL
jgi:hypothetical protein